MAIDVPTHEILPPGEAPVLDWETGKPEPVLFPVDRIGAEAATTLGRALGKFGPDPSVRLRETLDCHLGDGAARAMRDIARGAGR